MGDHEPWYEIFNDHRYNSENNKKRVVKMAYSMVKMAHFCISSGPPVPPGIDAYAAGGTDPPVSPALEPEAEPGSSGISVAPHPC